MDTAEQTQEVSRLPLWRSCLEEMIANGVDHGSVYSAEYFEQALKAKRDSIGFGLGISEIRKRLEHKGLYLSGRGVGDCEYVVIPAEDNLAQSASHSRQAMNFLRRACTLLVCTKLELLSPDHRGNHERAMEKAAKRLALLGRKVPQIETPATQRAPRGGSFFAPKS